MKNKSEIKDWAVFGAIISGLIAVLAFVLVFLGLSALAVGFGFSDGLTSGGAFASALIIFLPVLVFAMIFGAVKWGALGIAYNYLLHKHLDKHSVYWQLTGLFFAVNLTSDLFMKTVIDLPYSAVSLISIMVSVYIVLGLAKWFKLKVPVKGKK